MINSYLDLLQKQLKDDLDDKQRTMMNYAHDAAIRLDRMLVSLLEYSRVGRLGEPMSCISSRKAMEEALHYLQPQIDELQTQIQVQPEGWPQVFASPDELTRLFQNLIGNSIKYHQPNQLPQIHLSVKRQGSMTLFTVSDQGIGIEPDQSHRLFRVFQRLHTRDEFEGTGVGLAICRKIVERHGGSISQTSEGLNKGSQFSFTLPVC